MKKDIKNLNKFTSDFIVSSRGQLDYPGMNTLIPNANGSITMKGVKHNVLGIDDLGNKKIMKPKGEYQFPGDSVYEIPLKKRGGEFKKGLVSNPKKTKKSLASKKYSRSLSATNILFTENSLFKKPKSRKNKVYDPKAKYYAEGGDTGCPNGQVWSKKDKRCIDLPVFGNSLNSEPFIKSSNLNNALDIKPLNSFSDFGKIKPKKIPVVEDSFLETLEKDINDFLENPLKKASQVSESLKEKGEDPSDALRHSTAGALTAQTIANKTGNIPFISNPLGYLGANIAGIGHELSTLSQAYLDDRPWSVKLQESLEDIYNNSAGANTIFSNKSEKDKINYLLKLTRTNQLPDGYGEERPFRDNPKWTDPYNQKQYGGENKFDDGGTIYTVEGSDGVYKKINGKWQVDWNRSGKYQPLSKGDVKARTAILDKMAKPLYDKDYDEMVAYKNLSAEDKINKFEPKKELTKEELKNISNRLGRDYKPEDTKLQSVDMVYPEKYIIGPGGGLLNQGLKTGVGAIEKLAATKIPGLFGTTVGQAAGAGFAADALVNQFPGAISDIGKGEYEDAAEKALYGTLGLVGSGIGKGVVSGAKDLSKFLGTDSGVKSFGKPIIKYVNNKYTNIAEGSNMFDYAWKSPAARFDKNTLKTYTEAGDIIAPEMPQSKAIFDKLKTNPNLTAEELAIIKDYEATSINYKNGPNKEKLDAIIKKSGLILDEPTVMSRRIDASNADNFNPVNGIFNTKRPTSWSAGRDALGNTDYSGSADRMVMKLQPGEYSILKNPYLENSPETLDELRKMYEPMGSLEHRMQFVTGKPRIDERELLLGSGADLKQIGKVKNNFGGFDYVMKNLNKKQDGGENENPPDKVKNLNEVTVYENQEKRKLQGSLMDRLKQVKKAYNDHRVNLGLQKQKQSTEGTSSIISLKDQIQSYKKELNEEKKSYDKASKALNVLKKYNPESYKKAKVSDVLNSTGVDDLRNLYKEGKISDATFMDFYDNFGKSYDREATRTTEEDQLKLENSWYGQPDEEGRTRWMDNPNNVSKVAQAVAIGVPLAAAAPIMAPAIGATLAVPEISGGLNAYFGYHGLKEFGNEDSHTRKSMSRAYDDPTGSNIGDAAWDVGMNSLNFVGLPFSKAIKGSKNLAKLFSTDSKAAFVTDDVVLDLESQIAKLKEQEVLAEESRKALWADYKAGNITAEEYTAGAKKLNPGLEGTNPRFELEKQLREYKVKQDIINVPQQNILKSEEQLGKNISDGGTNTKGVFELGDDHVARLSAHGYDDASLLVKYSDKIKSPRIAKTLQVKELNGKVYQVQEKVAGTPIASLTETELQNIPKEHIDNFWKDKAELDNLGLSIDISGGKSNILYDPKKGFQFIDLGIGESSANEVFAQTYKGLKLPGSTNVSTTNNVDDLVDLWRIQEKNGKTFAQLAEEGKINPLFNNPATLAKKAEEEKYFGQWFTKDKNDFNFYKADREFTNPEIINLKIPKSKLEQYSQYDKSLSRAPDREFVIPFEEQKLYKELPGSPNAVDNVQKAGFLNPLALIDRVTPRFPAMTAILGMEDDVVNWSPLSLIPGYGKKLAEPGFTYPINSGNTEITAYRKFGNSLDDLINSKSFKPEGGFRMGADQIKNEGNWAEAGIANENYKGVFAAGMNPRVEGTNIQLQNWNKRNGVVGMTKQGNPAIPITDPGLSFYRRLPFSNRYVSIDKQKLIDNKFQLATQLPHVQSLIEKYGIAAAYALTFGYLQNGKEGAIENLKTVNKYSIDPIKNWSKTAWDELENTLNQKQKGGTTNDYVNDLTPEEIQKYIDGGYIVEEIN